MAVTNFTSYLGLALPTDGDLDGTWGTTVNDSITTLIDYAIAGTTTLSVDADVTLTDTDGSANQTRQAILLWTASGSATRTITAPARSKSYVVINATGGSQSIKLVGAGPTTGITVATGERCVAAWNGSDFVKVASSVPDGVTSVAMSVPTGLAISGSPVTSTGTLAVTYEAGYSIPTTASQSNWDAAYTQRLQWDGGSTNLVAATGRTSLGGTTVGQSYFTLTNPGAITFPRMNADNTVSALSAADFRTAIGAGTSSTTGTVTSVALSAPTGLTVSGSPVTSSGTLALSLTAGYSIPTTSSQSNWDAAYTQRLQWDGGSTNLVASTGRTSLGGTTVGQSFFTLTNPSAVTFPRINADNTVSALSAADFRTAIGAGTGGGTVTGVTASSPLASSGGTAPNISISSSTGSGAVVLANSPSLVTPALGTPSSGNLVNCTFPTLNQNTTGTAASTPKLLTSNFTVEESGGVLLFKYGSTAIASLDSSGNFKALANVTAYGTI